MNFIYYLLGLLVGVVLGGYILLYGRRALWATLGIVGLAATANLLAVLVAGVDSGRDLIGLQAWDLLGIALAVGVVGMIVGRIARSLAALLVGFVAGANFALWLFEISTYLITSLAQLSDQIAQWVGLVIIVLGGLLGLWFAHRFRDEALIVITMVLGTQMIILGLGLSTNTSFTAIVALCLALFGVVRQYAEYSEELDSDFTKNAGEYQSPIGQAP